MLIKQKIGKGKFIIYSHGFDLNLNPDKFIKSQNMKKAKKKPKKGVKQWMRK